MIHNDKMHLFCFVVLFQLRISFYGMKFGIKYDRVEGGKCDQFWKNLQKNLPK